jgi:D-glycero-alpha-D-manno-heptose 1-phosphate guanylyltransferase
MNGDSYCAADLARLAAWHRDGGFVGSLVLTHVPDASRFGRVLTDPNGRVTSFEEKRPDSGPGWINAGIYLLDSALLSEIPPNKAVSIEREMFPQWIPRGLGGFARACPFLDIGTPESYAATERFFESLGEGE